MADLAKHHTDHIPFFSVIIPIYNKERYLAETLQSVLSQTFPDFELILVLDPSIDRSNEIAHSFHDSRIRILSRNTPGPGGYAARNLGIKNAKAQWISFLDADDLWLENHLQELHLAIIAKGKEFDVFCTGYKTERGGKLNDTLYSKRFNSIGSHAFDLVEFLLYKPVHTINSAIKTTLLRNVGGFPEKGFKRGGDYDTWLRTLYKARRGYWISHVTAIYNKNVEDGVIKSSLPYTSGHPVRLTVLELLKDNNDPQVADALKRYSNSFVITGVKRRLKLGQLTSDDVRALFSDVFSRKWQLIAFRMAAMMPFAMQRGVISGIYGRR